MVPTRIFPRALISLAVCMLLHLAPALAKGPGDLDPSFGAGGVTNFSSGRPARGNSMALQNDGKILVVGHEEYFAMDPDFAVVRYDTNGAPDSTFGNGGKVLTPLFKGQWDFANAVSIQSDGKIVVAGTTSMNAEIDLALARYNADGTLDKAFGLGDGLLTYAPLGVGAELVSSMVLQNDGKILVAGRTDLASFLVVRFLPDGSMPDPGFKDAGRMVVPVGDGGCPNAVAVQWDGKVVVAGYAYQSGFKRFALARFMPAGGLDLGFGTAGRVIVSAGAYDNAANCMVLQNDHKFLLGGYSDVGNGQDFTLVRLTELGALDSTFGNNGVVRADLGSTNEACMSLALQSDGNIVAAGYTTNASSRGHRFALARFTPQGILDSRFGNAGKVNTDIAGEGSSVAVQSDGNIVVAGGDDFTVARFIGLATPEMVVEQPEGTVLTNRGPEVDCGPAELGAVPAVRWFTVRNTGSDLLTGLALSKDGVDSADFAVGPLGATELLPGLSTTFSVTFTPRALGPRRAALHLASNDADQNPFEIQLVGAGVPQVAITTANPLPSGTVGAPYVMAFSTGAGGASPLTWSVEAGYLPEGLVVGSSGLLVGTPTVAGSAHFTARVQSAGNSSSATKEFDLRILGPTTPGALDTSFGPGGSVVTGNEGRQAHGYSVAVQKDGKILVAGGWQNGFDLDFALIRYLPDGQLDRSFGGSGLVTTDFGNDQDEAYSVVLQDDGKILVAGCASIDFNYCFALARYEADGQPDSSFNGDGKVTTAIGNQSDIGRSVLVQGDGKIVVAGYSYNGVKNDFALVRYAPDGQLDPGFGSGGKVTTPIGNDDQAESVALQRDGKIVVAGHSRAANQDIALARYLPDGTLDTGFGTGGKVTTDIAGFHDFGYGVVLQSDGKIVVAGDTVAGGTNSDLALLRYQTNGNLDASFGTGGVVVTPIGPYGDYGQSVALQSDGKLLVAGQSAGGWSYVFALARYLADGRLDLTFGNSGTLTTTLAGTGDVGTSMALQRDGKIVVAGYSLNRGLGSAFAVARYLGVTEPEIAVEQPDGNNLVDGVSTIGFGNLATNSGSATRSFTVRNASIAGLTGLAVSIDGLNAADFSVGLLDAASLAPGASSTFTVTFAADGLGQRSASLHITSNDADENPFDIALTGKGVPPPQITTTTPLPPGVVGEAYGLQLVASGGTEPYTWSVNSGALPPGLHLSGAGVLSGTPTLAADAIFTLGVRTDESLEAVKEFALTIQERIAWTNVAGGNWTEKANWSPNKVPSSRSIVLINCPGTYTVTLDYNAECQSLWLGGAPGIQSLDWNYGSFTGALLVNTNAVVNLVGGSITLDGILDNHGRINWPAGQQVNWRLNQNSSLLNRPGGLLDLQGHGSFYNLPASFQNEGTVRKSFDTGAIIIPAGLNFSNAGLLDVQTGRLSLQGLESSNRVNVAQGAVVEMTKGTFNFRAGHSFGGTGTWWVHGSPAINGVLDGQVLFTVSEAGQFDARLASTLWWTNGNLSGNLTVDQGGALNFTSMSVLGLMTNYGQLTWAGPSGAWYWYPGSGLENMAGGTLDVAFDATLNLPAGAWLNNYGTILKSGGTNLASFRGQNVYTNYGLIDVRAGRLEFLHGLSSSGTINVARNATLEFRGYDVNLGPSHKFTGEGLCAFGASSLRLKGHLDGTVTFQMDYGTDFDATLNAPMIWKYGVQSGNLTVGPRGLLTMLAPGDHAGNLTNYGTVLWQSPQATSWRWNENARFYNASGGLFEMQGDHRFYAGATTNLAFENAGIFRKSKGTATAFVDASLAFTNSGALEVQAGKLWFRSPFTQTASGSMSVSLGGVTPMTQYSQVQFDQPPVLAGRFGAGTSGEFRPPAGAAFTVLSYPSAIGGFSGLNRIDLGSGLSLAPQFLPTSLVLTAGQGTALPSLVITRGPGSLRLNLPEGYSDWRLFSATNLAQPQWELVPLTQGAAVDLPAAKPQEFFRLQAP